MSAAIRNGIGASLLVAILVGCAQAGGSAIESAHALGGTCLASFSADRCQALAFGAATQAGVPFERVAAIDVVPNPSPDSMPDFAHRTFLEVTLADGRVLSMAISCPGIAAAFDPKCMPEPVVPLAYPRPGSGGYTDTPENATPFPSLDPTAVDHARPLQVSQLVVPITALGRQTIVVGTAQLPNGYLAQGDFALSDPWPSSVLFNDGIRLEIRPTGGGSPLQNLYEHGWHEGVEQVEATITFDVAWFEPGATFTIVNVVVR